MDCVTKESSLAFQRGVMLPAGKRVINFSVMFAASEENEIPIALY